jgi:hypothetical protein
VSNLHWAEPWIDFESASEATVHRGETDPPGSFVAEVREYPSGGYMLHVELDVYNLSDGKRLAEKILALVNEPAKEVPSSNQLIAMGLSHHAACTVWAGYTCTCKVGRK